MADGDLVRCERRDDGVAVVRLDNGKMNTLTVDLLGRLGEIAADLTEDPAGAVVITGSDRVFAAGAEITAFLGDADAASVDAPTPVADSADLAALGRAFLDALDAVAAIPRPTIAAVPGFALGGGCELALACDFRVAGERAVFGQPEILLGIIPGGGGTQRLARLIGPARAKDLVFTGRQVKADEALALGLVDRLVEGDRLMEEATAWAAELAAGPGATLALAKRAVDEGLDRSLAEGLELEQDLFVESFTTDEAAIGINSFLVEGPGRARFTGR